MLLQERLIRQLIFPYVNQGGVIMKIRTDVNDVLIAHQSQSRGLNVQKPLKQQNNNVVTKSQPYNQSLADKLRLERSIGDALSIAHISQNLIQKAILVSSRLQGITSQAINTGKMNNNEVSSVLSDINATISNYGEQVIQPVQTRPIQQIDAVAGLPDIRNDLTDLKKVAENVNNSNNVAGLNTVQKTAADLNDKLEITRDIQINIQKAFVKQLDRSIPENSLNELNSAAKTADLIVSNPMQALKSQGNINPGNVETSLIG